MANIRGFSGPGEATSLPPEIAPGVLGRVPLEMES